MADSNSPAFQPPLNSIVQGPDAPGIISVGRKPDLEIGNRTSQQRGLMNDSTATGPVRNIKNGM
jgi:hypothetical protein